MSDKYLFFVVIYTFPKNISNFIKSEDKKFINKKYSDLIEELNLLTANRNCVQVFSYDQAYRDFGYTPMALKDGINLEVEEYINSKD